MHGESLWLCIYILCTSTSTGTHGHAPTSPPPSHMHIHIPHHPLHTHTHIHTHPAHSTYTHTHRSSTYSCTRFSRITWTHLTNTPTLQYCKYQRLYSSYASQVRYTVVTLCVCVCLCVCRLRTAIYSCSRINKVQVRVSIGFYSCFLEF